MSKNMMNDQKSCYCSFPPLEKEGKERRERAIGHKSSNLLFLAPKPLSHVRFSPFSISMDDGVTSNGGAGGGGRPPRLPRWTRQEILVLIQGKKVAESRGKGRVGSRIQQLGDRDGDGLSSSTSPMVGGTTTVEPKWASVSSYCRKHGVERGSVQCRKRWSNLAGDYKKIKEWESKRNGGSAEGESFWVMRNDLRREKKLPGFFDRDVFDILDGKVIGKEVEVEVVVDPKGDEGNLKEVLVEQREKNAVFDSGRTAKDDGLFSDSDEEERPPASASAGVAVAVMPISERKLLSSCPSPSDQGREKEKQSAEEPEEGRNKRRRRSQEEEEQTEGDSNLQTHLIEILNQNSRMLREQLEAQNMNSQLEREQRRDQTNSVVEVLGKLADALGRIADKL